MTYTYDEADRLLTAERGGLTTTLTYDKAGRKLTMNDPDMGYWSYSNYDGLGNLITQTDARACTTTLSYDLLNRLTRKAFSGCTPTTAQIDHYYDGVPFSFDSQTYGGATNQAGYRTGMKVNGSNAATWGYDTRGRVILEQRIFAGVATPYTTSWTYNPADLPVTMTYPDGEVVTHTYDTARMLLERVTATGTFGSATYVDSTSYDAAARVTDRTLGTGGLKQKFVYYYAGATRIAMRTGSTLTYLLGDHLGSTSVVTDSNGALLMETRYKPFGEVRYATANATLPTRYTFTGQYSYVSDEATDAAGFGLMYFNARFYDPWLGRFSSADSIIPGAGNPQAWDRYAYANNSPLMYVDPTGHFGQCHANQSGYQCRITQNKVAALRNQWAAEAAARAALLQATRASASLNKMLSCRDSICESGVALQAGTTVNVPAPCISSYCDPNGANQSQYQEPNGFSMIWRSFMGDKYTPATMAALQLSFQMISDLGLAVALAQPELAIPGAILAVGAWSGARVAGGLSTSATVYQYSHSLNDTTMTDVAVSVLTTVIGLDPVYSDWMAVTSFVYSTVRTGVSIPWLP